MIEKNNLQNKEPFINKVICDDCLKIMKTLPDKCIDLVLTDPPYWIKDLLIKRQSIQ